MVSGAMRQILYPLYILYNLIRGASYRGGEGRAGFDLGLSLLQVQATEEVKGVLVQREIEYDAKVTALEREHARKVQLLLGQLSASQQGPLAAEAPSAQSAGSSVSNIDVSPGDQMHVSPGDR
eukprot:2730527-Pyramimonas_sp.AAC.3